jgi:aspartokinase
VSLIGFGLGSRPAAFLEAFRILEHAGIEVRGSFTGRQSLSFLVDHEQVREGMQALHQMYIESRDTENRDTALKPSLQMDRVPSIA